MKIALYGVSNSGKDYFINRATAKIDNLSHVPGSATLRRLALEKYGREFKSLTEAEQTDIRIAFTETAREIEEKTGHIIVDGHYAFPLGNDRYNVVFTEADRSLYDVFLYLNTEPGRIIENQKNARPGREPEKFSLQEIEAWQAFEIKNMSLMCQNLGRELLVLDGDFSCGLDFFSELLNSPERFLPEAIARRIVESNLSWLTGAETIILMDCDKTLSLNDTTKSFCERAGKEIQTLREIFRGEYYTVYQFYRAKRYYDEVKPAARYDEACAFAAENAPMNQALIKDILAAQIPAVTMGVTSGLVEIWSLIQKKHNFPQIVACSAQAGRKGEYVSTMVKAAIVKELRALRKKVLALGDSPIDILMLERADQGYLVTMPKLSSGVASYLAKTPGTKIRQLSYNLYKYAGLPEVDSIWQ